MAILAVALFPKPTSNWSVRVPRFIRFSLADGYIDKHEQEILEKVASANGVGRDELGRLIQEIRHAGVAD